MPHSPNPPTASDDPSVTSATASAVVATTLSIVTSLSSSRDSSWPAVLAFGHAENAFGDDVALNERRPARDRSAAGLIGEPQPTLVVGWRVGGTLLDKRELPTHLVELQAEIGDVLYQRAEEQFPDRGDGARGPVTGRSGDDPLPDQVVHERAPVQICDALSH